ncbi:MAG: L,D-transpeptidase [Brachymonas sp.]|nr:L,D-transpeptidase [Brachymonas sp.]
MKFTDRAFMFRLFSFARLHAPLALAGFFLFFARSAHAQNREPLPMHIVVIANNLKQLEAASGNRPFGIVDKAMARLFLFDATARHLGSTPVLLGLAKGDISPAGIGERPVSTIKAHEKITPSGRFVVELGTNLRGEEVAWLDYKEGLSMHPVLRTGDRLKRLATSTPDDNRISAGCINVPALFHRKTLLKLFMGRSGGVVYILPENQNPNDWVASLKVNQGGK